MPQTVAQWTHQIRNVHDWAYELHRPENRLYYLNGHTKYEYHEKRIKKANGRFRILACPSEELKAIQAWISRHILEQLPLEDCATAYRPGGRISDNVIPHRHNDYLICLDIEDFFGAISSARVYRVFRSVGFTPHMCHVFTNMCTYMGHLPQGGVTSPILSNLVARRMDRRIAGCCHNRGICYTRYSDDITLSSNNEGSLWRCAEMVKRIIVSEGFQVNEAKTRVLRPTRSRRVTGLVISDDHCVGVGRTRLRQLRAAIYRLETGSSHTSDRGTPLDSYVTGWMSYLHSVDPTRYRQLVRYREALRVRIAEDVERRSEPQGFNA